MADEKDPSEQPLSLSLAWYTQRKPVFTGGNRVQLLRGGLEMFPALVNAIDEARQTVWMANYLTSTEGLAATVLEALMRAARRGVAVHLVVDGVGSRAVPESTWQNMRDSGVQLAVYRPIKRLTALVFNSRNWRRMHLKVCVVDDAHGFVGGINLIDDHFDLAHGWASEPRLDYAVRVQGAALMPMAHTVRAMWTRANVGRDWRDDVMDWIKVPGRLRRLKRLRGVWERARLRLTVPEQLYLEARSNEREPMRCAFVLRDNLRQRRTIEQASIQAIRQARHRVDIITPYFYPGRALKRVLRQAAARGVTVRLLLQGKVDYRIAAVAARVLYDDLQRHGVRIHEYRAAWLHAKVLCVDDEWATVGSSNLDPLSMLMNLEGNVIVHDRAFAQTMAEALARDFGDSVEIPPPRDSPRSWWWGAQHAAIAWLAKTYLRLAGITGRY